MRVTIRFSLLVAVIAITTCGAAFSQDYPAKPIRFIMPYLPGGSADVFVRIIAKKISETLRQQVIADARPGGSGIIGAEIAAKSPPDGYTILMVNSAIMAVNPSLRSKLPYDPLKDFAPISKAISYPYVLVVHPALPVKNVREFVALAKARPGELTYGSAGVGNMNHLAGEVFASLTHTKLLHVPYKGSAGALAAVLGGEVSFMFDTQITSLPYIRTGKLRALGLTGIKRSPLMPQVATLRELGLADYEFTEWNGVVAPAGTPKPIVDRLNTEIIKALKTREVIDLLAKQGGNELIGNSPDEFREDIMAAIRKYAKFIKEANIKAE